MGIGKKIKCSKKIQFCCWSDSNFRTTKLIVKKSNRKSICNFFQPQNVLYSKPNGAVIPNRGAAAHQERCQGCRQIWITAFLLMFYYILCHQIVIYNQIMVPPTFLKSWRVPRTKKVEKHCNIDWTTCEKMSSNFRND